MEKYKLHSHAWQMVAESDGSTETEYEGLWVKLEDIETVDVNAHLNKYARSVIRKELIEKYGTKP